VSSFVPPSRRQHLGDVGVFPVLAGLGQNPTGSIDRKTLSVSAGQIPGTCRRLEFTELLLVPEQSQIVSVGLDVDEEPPTELAIHAADAQERCGDRAPRRERRAPSLPLPFFRPFRPLLWCGKIPGALDRLVRCVFQILPFSQK
jgi:hypothetical protein